MCLEFIRGFHPHHTGGDGLLKRIYHRYYNPGGGTGGGPRGGGGGYNQSGRGAHQAVPLDDHDDHFDQYTIRSSTLEAATDPSTGPRTPTPTTNLLSSSAQSESRSSLALAQNEGVITWTSVMATRSSLTLESLLAMSPIVNGVDLVGRACRQLFLSHLKSQTNVRDTFFPQHEPDRYEAHIDPQWFDFEDFANAFVCHALFQNKDEYYIYKMIDGEKVEELLTDFYLSPDWKKVGFALYTMLFKDLVVDRDNMIPFKAYIESDRRHWAGQLADQLRDPQWLHKFLHPAGQGRHNERQVRRDINILFVKLHLLDPTMVFPAFTTIQKAMPDLNLELVTTNYLGEPFDRRVIKADVQGAVNRPTLPKNAPKVSMEKVDVYYGIPVIEFIMLEPKQMGLWSGRYADNKRTTGVKDRCAIM